MHATPITEATIRQLLADAMPRQAQHVREITFPAGGYSKVAARVTFTDAPPIIVAARSRMRHIKDFTFAARVAEIFARHGIPVPRIITPPTRLGDTDIYYYIQSFEPGRHVLYPSLAQLREVGSYIGRIHTIALSDAECDMLTPHLSESRSFDYRRMAKLELPMGLVHGDLFPANLLFDETSGHLSAFLDMDEAEYIYLLKDLVKAIYGLCVTSADLTLDPTKVQALLAGYRSHRQLTRREIDSFFPILRTFAERLPGRYIASTGKADMFADPSHPPFIRSVPQRSAAILAQLENLTPEALLQIS